FGEIFLIELFSPIAVSLFTVLVFDLTPLGNQKGVSNGALLPGVLVTTWIANVVVALLLELIARRMFKKEKPQE
ncbi:MAG: hypothetical protein ACFFCS_17060, partial [Candidatus Hodarchaeota archaeon]